MSRKAMSNRRTKEETKAQIVELLRETGLKMTAREIGQGIKPSMARSAHLMQMLIELVDSGEICYHWHEWNCVISGWLFYAGECEGVSENQLSMFEEEMF